MDLTDIFEMDNAGGRDKSDPEKTSSAEQDITLEDRASVVASVFDEAEHRRKVYEDRRAQLMAQVELELDPLKNSWQEAREHFDGVCKDLLEEMEKSGIAKIPMSDRKPILLKTIVGRKRPITKKWLTEAFGSQRANEVWGKVPTYPDKKEIIVSPRFDDEPNT